MMNGCVWMHAELSDSLKPVYIDGSRDSLPMVCPFCTSIVSFIQHQTLILQQNGYGINSTMLFIWKELCRHSKATAAWGETIWAIAQQMVCVCFAVCPSTIPSWNAHPGNGDSACGKCIVWTEPKLKSIRCYPKMEKERIDFDYCGGAGSSLGRMRKASRKARMECKREVTAMHEIRLHAEIIMKFSVYARQQTVFVPVTRAKNNEPDINIYYDMEKNTVFEWDCTTYTMTDIHTRWQWMEDGGGGIHVPHVGTRWLSRFSILEMHIASPDDRVCVYGSPAPSKSNSVSTIYIYT